MNHLSLRHLPDIGLVPFIRLSWRLRTAGKRIASIGTEVIRSEQHVYAFGELTQTVLHAFSELFDEARSVSWHIYLDFGADPQQDWEGRNTINWEAPLAILIRFGECPALGFGIEFTERRIDIRQMQGVVGTSIAKEGRDWPILFIRRCIEYVRGSELFDAVRVYRADQSPYFFDPILPQAPGRTRRELVKESRARMRQRYDGSARRAGLTPFLKYYEWRK